MRRLALVALLLVLPSCAASGAKRPEWTKTGTDTQELNQDRYQCERENMRTVYWPAWEAGARRVDRDLFRSCMRARGWVHADD